MRGRLKTIGVITAVLVLGVTSSLFLLRGKPASADRGPDGAYGGARVEYELIDTSDLRSTDVYIPVYSGLNPPGSAITMTVMFSGANDGQVRLSTASGLSRVIGGAGLSSYVFILPPGDFIKDPNNNQYYAVVHVFLVSGAGTSKAFELLSSAGSIRYSSNLNDNKFAVANINRCDFGGDQRGCGDYFDYTLSFAPYCNQPSGRTFVDIYDPDNPFPLPDNSGNQFNTQAQRFSADIFDLGFNGTGPTTNVFPGNGGTLVGTWSSGRADVSTDVHLNFDYLQGHQYKLVLSHVYANNVLQFKLPFDSINSDLTCPVPDFDNTIQLTPAAQTVTVGTGSQLINFNLLVTTSGNIPSAPLDITGFNCTVPAACTSYFLPNGASAGGSYSAAAWHWTDPAPPVRVGNQFTAEADSFRVSPTTPTGTYTFQACVAPHNLAGGQNCDIATVQIINPKIPLLNVAAGDVHAGCGTSPTGDINVNAGSQAVEVVTASGTISGLSASAGTNRATGSGYIPNTTFPLCKPPLVTIAANYVAANPVPAGQLLSGSVDVGTLPSGLYEATSDISLHGNVNSNLTIYVAGNHTATISGNIVQSQPVVARTSQPGLGLIVDGTVNVDPAATELDAYVYAGGSGAPGVINTCFPQVVGCNSVLQVNGLLMGANVKLQRWGVLSALQQTLAENVILNGQLYLNAPPLFDQSAVSYTDVNGRGEQAPRY